MFEYLLNIEIQDFINKNTTVSLTKLALQKNPFPEVNWQEILSQIAAKAKAKQKLPTWFQTKNIVYPSKVSVEQTSSERTAIYKSELISGKSLIDLTGGFGVDDYYFSKKIESVTYCEINDDLFHRAVHNFRVLERNNITCLLGDSYEVLKNLEKKFDWIYIDPSRRSDSQQKVFLLKDCLPNVPELLNFYFEYSSHILIKTAPLLDISAGLNELKNVRCIHIVAVENEVKELLWEIEKEYSSQCLIKTINIGKEKDEVFEFIWKTNQKNHSFSLPKKYLYEPNAAIMKSGGFEELSAYLNIEKLHQHSHLFTSNDLIDFPGRIFEILNMIPYDKRNMKLFIENKKMNVTTRNFTETVESIRKKWKIKDGGEEYGFFTTDQNENKIILICKKVVLDIS